MSGKPDWIPQDDWDNFIAKPAREAERRRADAALIRVAEHLDRQSSLPARPAESPPVAAMREAKERAIAAQDFETAANLREIEKRLMRGK